MFGAESPGTPVVSHGPNDSHLAGYRPKGRWVRSALSGKRINVDRIDQERAAMNSPTGLMPTPPTDSTIEQVLVTGDLAKLTPAQRVSYYNAVCKSLDLNPLTKPFAYISLNGKLVLYALKDCTEQLRNNRAVTIAIPAREVVEDCYVVTARASLPSGRSDESLGAVSIGGLKGEARANALMKAETKAKRRVTLSICGLGMLDETEVETIDLHESRSPDGDGHVLESRSGNQGIRNRRDLPNEVRTTSGPVGDGADPKGSVDVSVEQTRAGSEPADSHSDDGPDLTSALPPGARLVKTVGPGRAGAEAEITFTNGDHYLTWKKGIKDVATLFKTKQTPCFPDLKKSQSGNYRIEGLVAVPEDYAPPAGLPQPDVRVDPDTIPF